MIDSNTALAFSLYENKGVYALLLGSGVSRSAEIPTGWEITLDLARRVALLEDEPEQADWAAWHQRRFGKPPSYSDLLDILAPTPAERRSLLHSYIVPTVEDHEEGRRTPTKAHRAIARLVRDGFIRVIITTNFDRLLETALRAENIEPMVIRSDDDLVGAPPLGHAQCYILKVHGDYLDTRLRNTEGELSAYSPQQDALLDRIIDEHGLIICGWSSDWDTALRAAINRAPSRRYPLFWASRGEPSDAARDVISQRAGRVIAIDSADDFFTSLQARVEAQAALQRPNPMSVELLVATVKKQMARPEGRIALGDTVEQEVRRVREALKASEFGVNGHPTPDGFRKRVGSYAALCEPLFRVAFTLGRWGDGSEFGLIQDMATTLLDRPSEGSTILLDLSVMPGILASWGYLLGAAKAERPKVIARLLQTALHDAHRSNPTKAALRLNIEAWTQQAESFWKTFDGMERHYLPGCDVMHPMVRDWLTTEFLNPQGFELAWGWVEIFAGLEFLTERMDKASLRLAVEAGNRTPYVPIGRMTYDSIVGPRLLEQLGRPQTQADLAAAGFASGDQEYIALAQKWMADYAARKAW